MDASSAFIQQQRHPQNHPQNSLQKMSLGNIEEELQDPTSIDAVSLETIGGSNNSSRAGFQLHDPTSNSSASFGASAFDRSSIIAADSPASLSAVVPHQRPQQFEATADFPRIGSSMVSMGQPGFTVSQQHHQQSSHMPLSASVNLYPAPLSTPGTLSNSSNSGNNHAPDPVIPGTYGQQSSWLWNAYQVEYVPGLVDSMLQTRQQHQQTLQQHQQQQHVQAIEHPQFHHQGSMETGFWRPPNQMDIGIDALSSVPATVSTSSSSVNSQNSPLSSTRQEGEVMVRRRSSRAKALSSPLLPIGHKIHSPLVGSGAMRRPRARSTVTSPIFTETALLSPRSSFSSPTLTTSGMQGVGRPEVSGGTEMMGFPNQNQQRIQSQSGAHPLSPEINYPTIGDMRSLQYFQQIPNNNSTISAPDTVLAGGVPSILDSRFELDLASLLSSDINALGFQDSLSPSLTRSATSSPSPSTYSSPSPSPTMPASTASTNTYAIASGAQHHSLLLPPLLPCPATGCPKAFSRVHNLSVHLTTVHNINAQDLDLSSLSAQLSPCPSPSSPPGSIAFKSSSMSPSPSSSSFALSSSTGSSNAGVPTQPKPFPCHLCTRIFSRKHDLQRHIRVHTGSKPFICMSCQKAFARTDALCRHYKVEESCRKLLAQLEADQAIKKLQDSQVQQTLQLEAKELQKAQKLRQQTQQQQHLQQ